MYVFRYWRRILIDINGEVDFNDDIIMTKSFFRHWLIIIIECRLLNIDGEYWRISMYFDIEKEWRIIDIHLLTYNIEEEVGL